MASSRENQSYANQECFVGDDANNGAGGDTAPAFGADEGSSGPVGADGDGRSSPGDGEGVDGAAKVVKICKQCMVSQSGAGQYCSECGARLVPIRAVRQSYVGETVGGKYEIVDRLGEGGMGEVYLGVNEPLGQQVAVKFLGQKFTADERIIMRFLNEARSYCKVSHPNAVTLLEYGQHDDGALYLITEFIDGDSLTDTLKAVGPLGLDAVVSVASQICEVLSAAHRQGVIHRDLKPDNLMLMATSGGRYAVKVLDFGIAKIVDDDDHHAPMTETGSVFGTPEFMAPEQARGDSVDPRADIYAMGIILYYMLTGKLPFKGTNKLIVLNKQINEAPGPASQAHPDIEVDARLEEVIATCLQKDPDQRYQTADALIEALEDVRQRAGVDEPTAEHSSNEQPISAGDTNAGSDARQDIHDHETRAYDFAGDFLTDPDRPAGVELGDIDEPVDAIGSVDAVGPADAMGPVDAVDLADEQGHPGRATRVGGAGQGRMLGAVAVVAVVAAGAALMWSMWADEPPAKAASPPDIDQVLADGQVLGSMAAARHSLDLGDVDGARAAIGAADEQVDDAHLTADVRQERARLRGQLERLVGLEAQFEAAVGRRDCERAEQLYRQVEQVAKPAGAALEARLDTCHQTAGDQRSDDKKQPARPAEPGPAPSEAAPSKAPTTAPEPAGDGRAPDTSETNEASDGTGIPGPGEADRAGPSDERPADEKPADGFSLPPKTIE